MQTILASIIVKHIQQDKSIICNVCNSTRTSHTHISNDLSPSTERKVCMLEWKWVKMMQIGGRMLLV
jgi:hypothetical protein